MKILVVSLLRLGDIILTAPILQGLKERHPGAQIDLLINAQFKGVTPLLPQVAKVHLFERETLQKGLGEAGVPLFESFERLDLLLETLADENYDQVINLTHTRLSGWLLGLIPARKKLGLSFDAAGVGVLGSDWFRFLNNQVEVESSETYHFTDLFRFAVDLNDPISLALLETEKGREEVRRAIQTTGEKNLVVVQALTSDVKKNWGLGAWSRMLTSFARAHSGAHLVLLGAPNEKADLVKLQASLAEQGCPSQVAILSLEAAFSLLKMARLLVTGDTSIKHLACQAGTPVVEISLGSSDALRTGAYADGSLIIQTKESCAPCVHSRPCHRDRHACAEKIPAEAVALIAGEIYEGRNFQLKAIADEYENEIEVLRVENREGSFWSATSIREKFSEKTVARWMDLACKKIWLTSEDRRGTEIQALARYFKKLYPETSEIEWRFLIEDFEKQVEFVASRINGYRIGLEHLKGGFENPKRMGEFVESLIQLREKIKRSPLMKSFASSLDQIIEDDVSPPFVRLRRMVGVVDEIDARTMIHLGLLRGLMSEMTIGMTTNMNTDRGSERA